MSALKLDPTFTATVAQLAALLNGSAEFEVPPEWAAALREGLERILTDRVYLTLYLRHLDALLARPLRFRKAMPRARQEIVLAEGLARLEPRELGILALNPHQL